MLLLQLAIMLAAAKVAGHVAARYGQPPVLGQLLIGVGLGSVPFFARGDQQQVAELASLGVILLMFVAGLETDWDQLLACGKPAFLSASAGVALPLLGGLLAGLAFGLGFVEALFVGVVLTATSVSITAQTLMELGSLQTREGATVLGAAVIDDVIGLVVFSVAIAWTGSQAASLGPLAVGLFAFFVGSATVAPRLIAWAMQAADRLRGLESVLAVALGIGLLYAFFAEWAGLAAITGAYMAGLIINRHNGHAAVLERTRIVAYGLFVPVFLVKTGIDARLSELSGAALAFVLVTAGVAIATKVVGCGLGARLGGLSLRGSVVVGVAMISRGEVALVVASLARGLDVISGTVFSASVVVVVVTTLVTPPLLRLVLSPRSGPRLRVLPDAAA